MESYDFDFSRISTILGKLRYSKVLRQNRIMIYTKARKSTISKLGRVIERGIVAVGIDYYLRSHYFTFLIKIDPLLIQLDLNRPNYGDYEGYLELRKVLKHDYGFTDTISISHTDRILGYKKIILHPNWGGTPVDLVQSIAIVEAYYKTAHFIRLIHRGEKFRERFLSTIFMEEDRIAAIFRLSDQEIRDLVFRNLVFKSKRAIPKPRENKKPKTRDPDENWEIRRLV